MSGSLTLDYMCCINKTHDNDIVPPSTANRPPIRPESPHIRSTTKLYATVEDRDNDVDMFPTEIRLVFADFLRSFRDVLGVALVMASSRAAEGVVLLFFMCHFRFCPLPLDASSFGRRGRRPPRANQLVRYPTNLG
eukprot:6213024-Pleurochrysis_carterae.AAC.9